MPNEVMPALTIATDNELKGHKNLRQKNAPGHVSSSPGLHDGAKLNQEKNKGAAGMA